MFETILNICEEIGSNKISPNFSNYDVSLNLLIDLNCEISSILALADERFFGISELGQLITDIDICIHELYNSFSFFNKNTVFLSFHQNMMEFADLVLRQAQTAYLPTNTSVYSRYEALYRQITINEFREDTFLKLIVLAENDVLMSISSDRFDSANFARISYFRFLEQTNPIGAVIPDNFLHRNNLLHLNLITKCKQISIKYA